VVDGIAPAPSGPPFERADLRAEARVVEQHDPLTREPREQVAVELRLRAIGGLVRDPMAAERVARPLAGITVPGDARDLVGCEQRRELGHYVGGVARGPALRWSSTVRVTVVSGRSRTPSDPVAKLSR
jgi:hypothetical protein